jgi:hypothetical protein
MLWLTVSQPVSPGVKPHLGPKTILAWTVQKTPPPRIHTLSSNVWSGLLPSDGLGVTDVEACFGCHGNMFTGHGLISLFLFNHASFQLSCHNIFLKACRYLMFIPKEEVTDWEVTIPHCFSWCTVLPRFHLRVCQTYNTYWIRSWVHPRGSLKVEENIKIFCLCWEWNHDSAVIQPIL